MSSLQDVIAQVLPSISPLPTSFECKWILLVAVFFRKDIIMKLVLF